MRTEGDPTSETHYRMAGLSGIELSVKVRSFQWLYFVPVQGQGWKSNGFSGSFDGLAVNRNGLNQPMDFGQSQSICHLFDFVGKTG